MKNIKRKRSSYFLLIIFCFIVAYFSYTIYEKSVVSELIIEANYGDKLTDYFSDDDELSLQNLYIEYTECLINRDKKYKPLINNNIKIKIKKDYIYIVFDVQTLLEKELLKRIFNSQFLEDTSGPNLLILDVFHSDVKRTFSSETFFCSELSENLIDSFKSKINNFIKIKSDSLKKKSYYFYDTFEVIEFKYNPVDETYVFKVENKVDMYQEKYITDLLNESKTFLDHYKVKRLHFVTVLPSYSVSTPPNG